MRQQNLFILGKKTIVKHIIYSSNGILFNHESPLRGETFVTRKITMAIADIYHGSAKFWIETLMLKETGSCKDYVEGM